MQPERCLQLCLLGTPQSGASTLLRIHRAASLEESQDGAIVPPAAVESFVTTAELEGEPWKVRFVDNVAQPNLSIIRNSALSSAHVVLFCFSINAFPTSDEIWNEYLTVQWAAGSDAPAILVGLKGDLRDSADPGNGEGAEGGEEEEGLISQEQGRLLAERLGFLQYLECSSTSPETVQAVLTEALLAAKDYYACQWQKDKSVPSWFRCYKSIHDFRGSDAPLGENEEAQPDWLHHERQNVDDDQQPLDLEQVRRSLSMLGRTPSRQHAYLRSDLSNRQLTTIDAIRNFGHLQFVDVSRNQLRTLEPLSSLRCLLKINASHNVLLRTQCFTAPDNLEVADLSYNLISDLGDWGVHKYLRELNLRGNLITEIGPGLLKNKELTTLDLSENQISAIENTEGLQLTCLYLAQNRLTSLKGVTSMHRLHTLDVRHNRITTLSSLSAEDLPSLRKLSVVDNGIHQISEVANLESFPLLCDLWLSSNPLAELAYFRSQVLHRLPRLRCLDDQPVAAEEKVKAEIVYGIDIEARREVFLEVLPKENYVDRRLITEEQIAEMETVAFGQQGDAGFYGRAEIGMVPPSDRSPMQDAQFRQRLAVARAGGAPRGVADLRSLSAPFAKVALYDEDWPLVAEVLAEGRIKHLFLEGGGLSTDAIREVVGMMGRPDASLFHLQIRNCPALAQMEKELNETFPVAHGCSMEAIDCGLSVESVQRLRNKTKEAQQALAQRFPGEELKISPDDFPEELPLCHPIRWHYDEETSIEAFQNFTAVNGEAWCLQDSELILPEGTKIVLDWEIVEALEKARDEIFSDWGCSLEQQLDEGFDSYTLTGRALPESFFSCLSKVQNSVGCEQKLEKMELELLMGFMLWCGVDIGVQ